MVQKAPLNKSVFDDANADARMAVRFHLITDHNSFNRSGCSLNWSIQQSDYETNNRRKLHATRDSQIDARAADVVHEALETEWLIFRTHAPNSGWERIS